MKRAIVAALILGSSAAMADAQAQASRRDPTQPPPSYAPRVTAKAPIPAEGFRPEQVVKADGRAYLVWHGGRYAVGDTLEGARIERIEESEIWLRTDNGLRKVPMFAGVEKKREGTK